MEMITICAPEGIPEIVPGSDIGSLAAAALQRAGMKVQAGDVLVVASKVVSKAEGCIVQKDAMVPSAFAMTAAELTGRPPEYMELVLRETSHVVKMAPGVIICRTHHGFVLANAGVDATNTGTDNVYLTLPKDPDASARVIALAVERCTGVRPAVVISDTFGRPWRKGQCDLAIGVCGMQALRDETDGGCDAEGRPLRYTKPAIADELAAAADLACGKSRNLPIALIRGLIAPAGEGTAVDLLYATDDDLFL